MYGKKRNSIYEACYLLPREQGANIVQGPGEAITQETEGVRGLEIDFLWRQQINERRLRNSRVKIQSLANARV